MNHRYNLKSNCYEHWGKLSPLKSIALIKEIHATQHKRRDRDEYYTETHTYRHPTRRLRHQQTTITNYINKDILNIKQQKKSILL